MKAARIVLLMVLAQCTTPVLAGSITLLEGWYHVWGSAGYFLDMDSAVQSYDSGVVAYPVSGRADPHPLIRAESQCNILSVCAAAYCEGIMDLGGAGAHAEGYWVFRPNSSLFLLEISLEEMYLGDEVTIDLADLTTGEQRYYYSGVVDRGEFTTLPDGLPYAFKRDYERFFLDTTHEYSLHLDMGSSAQDNPYGLGYIRGVVPAPGAILLGTIGTGFFGWLRRRRTL